MSLKEYHAGEHPVFEEKKLFDEGINPEDTNTTNSKRNQLVQSKILIFMLAFFGVIIYIILDKIESTSSVISGLFTEFWIKGGHTISVLLVLSFLTTYFYQLLYIQSKYQKFIAEDNPSLHISIKYYPLPTLCIRIHRHVVSGNVENKAVCNYLQASKRIPLDFILWYIPGNPKAYLIVQTSFQVRFQIKNISQYLENFDFLLNSMKFDIVDPLIIPEYKHRKSLKSFNKISSIYEISERLTRGHISFPIMIHINYRIDKTKLQMAISFAVEKKREINSVKEFVQTISLRPSFSNYLRFKEVEDEVLQSLLVFPFTSIEDIVLLREHMPRMTNNDELSKMDQLILDRKMNDLSAPTEFKVFPYDFTQGGLITGGIGTGKTTMRLHIMEKLIQAGSNIIDIDFKGDAPRYKFFRKWGKVYIPKINLWINPFTVPRGKEESEYVNQLVRALIETLGDNFELTPPQRNLLYESVKMTVRLNGNSRDFLENITRLSFRDAKIIDNKQDHTAIALINKFQWLESTMKEIFWVPTSNLNSRNIIEQNSYFDLSAINDTVPVEQMRFLIDLILMNFTIALKSKGEQYRIDKKGKRIPKYVIFLDEGQYLVPRKEIGRNELSRLEEIISTFRYKGVAVIASGVSADLMSSMLTDSGFIAQFRSDSQVLIRTLGLNEEVSERVPKLLNYHAYIKGQSTNQEPQLVRTHQFPHEKMTEELYWNSVEVDPIKLLEEFRRDIISHIYIEFLEAVSYQVPRPLRTELEKIADSLLTEIDLSDFNELINLDKSLEKICTNIGNTLIQQFQSFNTTILSNSKEFFEVLYIRYIWKSLASSSFTIILTPGIRKQLMTSMATNYSRVINYLESLLNSINFN